MKLQLDEEILRGISKRLGCQSFGFQSLDDQLLALLEHRYLPSFLASELDLGFNPLLNDLKIDLLVKRYLANVSCLVTNLETKFGKIDDLEIMGDFHPNGLVKVLIKQKSRKKLVFKSNFEQERSVGVLINSLMPEMSPYLPVVEAQGGGWFSREFVEYDSEESDIDSIKNYYFELGRLLPMILALRMVDQNIDNLLYSKGKPLLIDTECFLLPKLKDADYSVFATGFINNGQRSDISAIEGESGNVMSYFVPILDRKSGVIGWSSKSKKAYLNKPYYKGKPSKIGNYLREFFAGYDEGTLLILNKKDLIGDYLESKNEVYTRLVLRPTSIYFMLLQKVCFPHVFTINNFSGNAFFRQELENKKIFLDGKWQNRSLINYESASLASGLIPSFYNNIKSRKVLDAYGNVLGKLTEKPLQIYEKQNKNLGDFLNANRMILTTHFNFYSK